MEPFTWALMGIAGALLAGNAVVIGLGKPRQDNVVVRFIPNPSMDAAFAFKGKNDLTSLPLPRKVPLESWAQLLTEFQSSHLVLKQKTELVYKRLAELEVRLNAFSHGQSQQSSSRENLLTRRHVDVLKKLIEHMHDLDNFKANTLVELKALKEITLDLTEERKGKSHGSKKNRVSAPTKKEGSDIPPQKSANVRGEKTNRLPPVLQEIAFRVKN
ncbi:MAG: hypothetical protein HY393_01080 [Candidatus Diapherotrites archaeon]|nr:hypothetical protein [Candidatus Diapherotrites archaeon]